MEAKRYLTIPRKQLSYGVVVDQSLGLSREKSRYCRAIGIGWLNSQAERR